MIGTRHDEHRYILCLGKPLFATVILRGNFCSNKLFPNLPRCYLHLFIRRLCAGI